MQELNFMDKNQDIFILQFTVQTVNIELNQVHHGVEIFGQADTQRYVLYALSSYAV